MITGYEEAKAEIEKMQRELYPNLFAEASNEDGGLGVIPEEMSEQTDNNDFTEDTSEAQASDDEMPDRRTDIDENEEDDNIEDEENDDEENEDEESEGENDTDDVS